MFRLRMMTKFIVFQILICLSSPKIVNEGKTCGQLETKILNLETNFKSLSHQFEEEKTKVALLENKVATKEDNIRMFTNRLDALENLVSKTLSNPFSKKMHLDGDILYVNCNYLKIEIRLTLFENFKNN